MLEFTAVKLTDKKLIQCYLSNIMPYFTEHSFTTLYAWQKSHNFEFAVNDDVLFIKTTYNNITSFMPPVVKTDERPKAAEPWLPRAYSEQYLTKYKIALEQIIAYCEQNQLPCILSEVGESDLPIIQGLLPDFFTVEEDRDNANYIYRVEDLSKLSGKGYHAKRNHLNALKRNHPDFQFMPLSAELIPQCRELINIWLEENKDGVISTIHQEEIALHRLFASFDELELKGACIMLNGKMQAFAIGEKISDEMCAILIEKADITHRGLYAAINQMFLLESWQDYTYVNRAEDMGLPGLRKTKMDYLPYHLAMKYILKAK